MKISLVTKMSIVFAVTSILLVTMFMGVTQYIFNTSFQIYVKENQEERDKQVLDYLTNVYQSHDELNEDIIMSIWHRAMMGHYYITLRDEEKNIIWKMERTGLKNFYNTTEQAERQKDVIETTHPIKVENRIVAYVDITQYKADILKATDKRFMRSLYIGLANASILGVIASALFGVVNAKALAKPIIQIKNIADILQKGNLTARVDLKTNTKEIDDLTMSINHLGSSLEEQEILRKRLTADISHELRTPLNVLKNHIEALIDGIWEPTTDRLIVCYDEVDRLTDLVKDLEKITSLEPELLVIEKEYHSINEIIEATISQFEPSFRSKNIQINFEAAEQIAAWVDKNKMKQVIFNLISNAYKFTEEQGSVTISLFYKDQDIVIQVADTGIGISPEDKKYIFERFYRCEKSRNRKTGGSGLGLAIVKRIIESQEGKITVESTVGIGSQFTIIFPRSLADLR